MPNKVITFEYELWCIDKEELGEEPIVWLLEWLLKLTRNNITYKIIKTEHGQPPHIIELRGKYNTIKKLLVEEKYIEKDDDLC